MVTRSEELSVPQNPNRKGLKKKEEEKSAKLIYVSWFGLAVRRWPGKQKAASARFRRFGSPFSSKRL